MQTIVANAVTNLLNGKETARQSFIAYCVDNAKITAAQASGVAAKYKAAKVVKFQPDGQFYVTHGVFLDADVIRNNA